MHVRQPGPHGLLPLEDAVVLLLAVLVLGSPERVRDALDGVDEGAGEVVRGVDLLLKGLMAMFWCCCLCDCVVCVVCVCG